MSNFLEKIALKWIKSENDYLKNLPYSNEFFEFELVGNKRTHYQVQQWVSESSVEIDELFKNWDGKSEIKYIIPNDGKGEIESFSIAFRKEKIPKKLPALGYLKLYKSSKVTDFICSDFLENKGMFLSEKAKLILEKFNIGNFKFYPAIIEHNGIKYNNFYFFRADINVDSYVDITKSSFFSQKPKYFGSEGRKKIKFKTRPDIKEFLIKNEGKEYNEKDFIYSEQIIFTENYPQTDFFFLKEFMKGSSKPFFSKRLKEALENCSGINFLETKKIK